MPVGPFSLWVDPRNSGWALELHGDCGESVQWLPGGDLSPAVRQDWEGCEAEASVLGSQSERRTAWWGG